MNAIISPFDYYINQLNISPKSNRSWVSGGLCPFHTDDKPGSFFINIDSGGFNCYSCGAKGHSVESFQQKLYGKDAFVKASTLNFNQHPIVKRSRYKKNTDYAKTRIDQILSQCIDIKDKTATPIHSYFKTRKIEGLLNNSIQDLFFHPNLKYYHRDNNISYHPCLIAVIRDINGHVTSLLRTYLTQNGDKAAVEEVKKVMPPIGNGLKGCAIKFCDVKDYVILAEGLETAIAAHLITNMPSWSCINSYGLRSIILPKGIKKCLICADNDKSKAGISAASEAAEKLALANIKCKIVIAQPPYDWKKKSFDMANIYEAD